MNRKKMAIQLLLIAVVLAVGVDLKAQNEITEKRDVSGFNKVGFSIAADLEIKQGDKEALIIKGNKADLDRIITEVENGKLKIRTERGTFKSMHNVEIYLVVKNLDELAVSGSGDVKIVSKFTADQFEIHLSGSGDIETENLVTNQLKVAVSGSGDIDLAGDAGSFLGIRLSGSGDIQAQDMQAKDVEVTISGSGDVRVWATENLRAQVSGSGDIRYRGSARVDAKVSGSGSVSPL